MTIVELITAQRDFFNTHTTKDIPFRVTQLLTFKKLLKENEAELYAAIHADFGKSEFEAYVTEISQIYHEIHTFIKHIKKWSAKKYVRTNLANLPGRSYIAPEPLGTTLIIGAWNYPYALSLLPIVSAIGAGNTAILKPSELPSETSKIMARLINSTFPSNFLHVIEGDAHQTTELLSHRFDKVFFTGSTHVGRIVYEAAAKHLTPVTLELGGKSPTFVLADANIAISAKRIAWAKLLNSGQSCVAPDYILVDASIEKEFLAALKVEFDTYYSPAGKNENYVQIINDTHFDRLHGLIDANHTYSGGHVDKPRRLISPTILTDITFDHEIMKEEIFGPILPVISFSNLDTAIAQVNAKPKALSCYVYSNNKQAINTIVHHVSFGGGAINESIHHLANSNLPFGGVGTSGIGSYHGKFGFDTFTHYKSILHKPTWFELPIKYAPYTQTKLKVLKWLLE
ncbi:MAG: aldehyde dehydrogenase [Fibrobacterales bacterium]